MDSGSVFTKHSQEYTLSFSPRFCKFEFNTTSDWLNHNGLANEVVLHSDAVESRKNVEKKTKNVLENG